MRRFFAPPENFSQQEIRLSEDESRHLRDVLRLRNGEQVAVFDGAGNEFSCLIERIERKTVTLAILEKTNAPAPESDLDLTLALALLKGEKFDFSVQKATELGVKRIVPLETGRADVKIKDEKDALKKLERWRRIALEAAKQSGRALIPVVEKTIGFDDFIKTNTGGAQILFAERGGNKLSRVLNTNYEKLTIFVGAEGGWEDREIESARRENAQIVTLGGRILRAETAAIVAVTLSQHLFGDLH